MKIMKSCVALALASLACAAHAQSGSANWNGFYIGANAGQVNGSSKMTTSVVFSPTGYFASSSTPAISSSGTGKVKPSGFAGGVDLGYNWQSGAVLVGAEFDWNSVGANKTRSASATYPCCAPTSYTVTEKSSIGDMMTLRGRIGYVHGNSLFYATAGGAQARIKLEDQFSDTFATAKESFKSSKSKTAAIYGVGYEYAFPKNWSLKAEYLHADFGKVSGTSTNLTAFTPPIAFPSNTFTHSSKTSLDLLRIGVNYRF